jgi:hypothetical protein
MGFLQDMHNLEQQADGTVAPAHAPDLALHGLAGAAAIQAVRFTGAVVDDQPTLELDLVITVDGGEPYALSHRQNVSRIAIPSFQPGAVVPVRVDPADPSSVTLG